MSSEAGLGGEEEHLERVQEVQALGCQTNKLQGCEV